MSNNYAELFPAERPNAPLIVALLGGTDPTALRAAIRAGTTAPFSLLTVHVSDWNRDLSPWPAESTFRGGEPYGGGAEDFLRHLTDELLPDALSMLSGQPPFFALAGYSLAGLFALWTMYATPIFTRIGSVSGSLWYPGFAEFAAGTPPAAAPERIYLSLGDREARTRHAVLRTVEDRTRELQRLWAGQGIETILETNPGNHFQQPTERTARGIVRLLSP